MGFQEACDLQIMHFLFEFFFFFFP
jgi:hypothetical protein